MDNITKSLQYFLRLLSIDFNLVQTAAIRNCETSTLFDMTSEDKDITISFLIEIAPKAHSIYISAHPHIVTNGTKVKKLRDLEKNWNRTRMFTVLNITRERFDSCGEWCSIQLFAKILSDINGLTRRLWMRYLEMILNEIQLLRTTISNIEN